MPADFHLEALKAQALAARTYIVDRLRSGDFSDMETFGEKARGAHVSDSVLHQAYRTDEQLKKTWGERYAAYSSRINRAVLDTRGDRKSTRLNSSHVKISYAVFCLKKKNRTR